MKMGRGVGGSGGSAEDVDVAKVPVYELTKGLKVTSGDLLRMHGLWLLGTSRLDPYKLSRIASPVLPMSNTPPQ